MQKCKLQFDDNKRIDVTLSPVSSQASFLDCLDFLPSCPMLRESVSIGKGKTIVELCSVEMALSVWNKSEDECLHLQGVRVCKSLREDVNS